MLKMYVWTDEIYDCRVAYAVAIAHDEDEARKVIIDDLDEFEKKYQLDSIFKFIARKPDAVYDHPSGLYIDREE